MSKPLLDIILEYGSYEEAENEFNRLPEGKFLGILDNYWYYKNDLALALAAYREKHDLPNKTNT